jgi:hypothetical protein
MRWYWALSSFWYLDTAMTGQSCNRSITDMNKKTPAFRGFFIVRRLA